MFIPIIIPSGNNGGEVDKRKLIIFLLIIAIIFFVFAVMMSLNVFFDINLFDYIPTNLFFVLCGIFGLSLPFLVKYLLRNKKIE